MQYVIVPDKQLDKYIEEISEENIVDILNESLPAPEICIDENGNEYVEVIKQDVSILIITDEAASFLKMKNSFVKVVTCKELRKVLELKRL